jgi:hypothetical protein
MKQLTMDGAREGMWEYYRTSIQMFAITLSPDQDP